MQIKWPEAILFDWDDTLVGSQALIDKALKNTLLQFGIKGWSDEQIKKMAAGSAREYFPEIFQDRTNSAIEFYRNQYRILSINGLQQLEGALTTLNLLLAHKFKPFIAVVSNKQGVLLRHEIDKLGWQNYFNSIVGAGDAIEDKPSIEPLKLALKNSGIDPTCDHVWFIGDSHFDMQAAHNFNCYSILIGEYNIGLLEPYFPHSHVRSHHELQMLLKKISDQIEN